MTTERFANQASTTLSSAIGSGDLSISVQGVTHFPTSPEFRIRISQELLLVTGVVGTTWTVTRGIEGTTSASHALGSTVVAVLTGGALDEMRAEIEAEDRTAGSLATTTTSVVVSGAAAPTVGQVLSATSGTAADWQTIPTPPTVTSHGSAASGDVVRLVSAGVLAQAQADSVSHAAAIIGMWDSIQVVPFSAQPIVNFDSTPVVGQPCYLSPTLAGALTSTAPVSGAVEVPPDLIVLQDYTIGTTYRARVGKSASIVSSLSVDQQFIANAAATLGVLPSSLRYKFDDFNTLPTTGYPAFGSMSYLITPGTHVNQTPAASLVDFSSSDGAYPQWAVSLGTPCSPSDLNLLASAALSAQKWMLRFKVKEHDANATFKMWLDRGSGFETCGFGLAQVPANNNILVFVHANINWEAVEVVAGQYTLLGVPDTNWHIVTMYSTGDGNVHFQLDNGTDYSVSMPVSGSAVVPRWFMLTEGAAIFDYWAFCSM